MDDQQMRRGVEVLEPFSTNAKNVKGKLVGFEYEVRLYENPDNVLHRLANQGHKFVKDHRTDRQKGYGEKFGPHKTVLDWGT